MAVVSVENKEDHGIISDPETTSAAELRGLHPPVIVPCERNGPIARS
jgi:hypothetical protein